MTNGGTDINTSSLLIASSLILVTLFFSYWQKLKLEKDTIIAVVRAVVQLIAVGFLLEYIFGLDNPLFTALMLLVMMSVAAVNAAKRGRAIPRVRTISFVAIFVGAALTLAVLLASRALHFAPAQVIPVGGMVISNAMIAIGLCYRALISNFTSRRGEVEARVALGATRKLAAMPIIRDSLRTGMVPTVDSAKTLGIVSLPGMMTGLILAGASPLLAIKYQIMVTFMLLSTTSIASFVACYIAYRMFFNERSQLISIPAN